MHPAMAISACDPAALTRRVSEGFRVSPRLCVGLVQQKRARSFSTEATTTVFTMADLQGKLDYEKPIKYVTPGPRIFPSRSSRYAFNLCTARSKCGDKEDMPRYNEKEDVAILNHLFLLCRQQVLLPAEAA